MNTDKEQKSKFNYKQIIDLICYSIVSARNLLQEPKIYGPLRAIEIACRLIDFIPLELQKDSPLLMLREHIEAAKSSVVEGEDSFQRHLDFLVSDVVAILNNRKKEDIK